MSDSLLHFNILDQCAIRKAQGHVAALRNAIETKKKRGLVEADAELFRTVWTWNESPTARVAAKNSSVQSVPTSIFCTII